jgi:L-alanine-DL-glutamate epimerase-like enolase superfamily enzyme
MWKLEVEVQAWPLKEPFEISRGVETQASTLLVTLTDGQGARGRGEACGVTYNGETPETMAVAIESVRGAITRGLSRMDLSTLLPAGGARAALDAALWDLEAKQSGIPAWRAAGLPRIEPVTTVFTIGIRDLGAYEETARAWAHFPTLKVKVGEDDPIAAIDAVLRGAPNARLIVDTNQAWTCDRLKDLAPDLLTRNVVLLEQPIPAGDVDGLAGYRCPIPLVADEAVQSRRDIERVSAIYDFVNIKLDKTGGLTEALLLADDAEKAGMALMVGCMLGTSLSVAPAFVLAQRCRFVDIDCPLLLERDIEGGLVFEGARVQPPLATLWG